MSWLPSGLTTPSKRRNQNRPLTQIRVYFRRFTFGLHLISFIFLSAFLMTTASGQNSKDSARLYETLLSDYNKLVRPVLNNTDKLIVKFKLKLSQLLDVHEKQQIVTSNVWMVHSWEDKKLVWNPEDYGGVEVLYVPSDVIWNPDIVLYNNADGNYQVTIMTKAKLTYNGTVEWTPPAIYKSMCQIDIEWFPLDVQTCEMKFGSWTYGGFEVDLIHMDDHLQYEGKEKAMGIDGEFNETIWVVNDGIDLSDYYPSVEWDILRVPAKRHEKRYPCCKSPFTDITYEIHLRRKTLFYTVNLMIPCVGISFLTALVFYLPSDGGEKISLCISILISLTVFFLLLVEIIPSTSLVIPLIGKYLLFTMVLVTFSVIITVITLNVHYRSPSTHKMSPWMRKLFIEILPYYLLMRRPVRNRENRVQLNPDSVSNLTMQLMPGAVTAKRRDTRNSSFSLRSRAARNSVLDHADYLSPTNRLSDAFVGSSRGGSMQQETTPMHSAVESVSFIAEHFRKEEEDQAVIEDWKYVSVVLDRIFLIVFTLVCAGGTLIIIFRAPTIYDNTPAIDEMTNLTLT